MYLSGLCGLSALFSLQTSQITLFKSVTLHCIARVASHSSQSWMTAVGLEEFKKSAKYSGANVDIWDCNRFNTAWIEELNGKKTEDTNRVWPQLQSNAKSLICYIKFSRLLL